MLTCTCNEWEGDGPCWFSPDDFQKLNTSMRKRCWSCGSLINMESECLEFERMRPPRDEIEDRIWGEDGEIPLASYWMCESCGEIYLNLTAIGYCINMDSNMNTLMTEYHEMTGFQQKGG